MWQQIRGFFVVQDEPFEPVPAELTPVLWLAYQRWQEQQGHVVTDGLQERSVLEMRRQGSVYQELRYLYPGPQACWLFLWHHLRRKKT